MPSIWKGAITFGLVNIPVHLEAAVRAEDRISFRQLHKDDLSPIKYQRVCEADGEPVEWSEIVKGYEYAKGRFVVLTDDDIKAATIATSRTIDILDFVPAAEIDARYYDKPYFILPAAGGEKAYALLREAMRGKQMVGIGKVVIRQNPHLVAIKTVDDALVLEIMRFSTELVEATTYSFPSSDLVRAQELRMAEQLVENLAESFHPEKYTDEYQDNLMRIIRAKMKGKKIEVEEAPEPESTRVVDLMARLQASLEQGRTKKGARAASQKNGAAAKSTRPSPKRRKTA